MVEISSGRSYCSIFILQSPVTFPIDTSGSTGGIWIIRNFQWSFHYIHFYISILHNFHCGSSATITYFNTIRFIILVRCNNRLYKRVGMGYITTTI